jgi:hypothetical protein
VINMLAVTENKYKIFYLFELFDKKVVNYSLFLNTFSNPWPWPYLYPSHHMLYQENQTNFSNLAPPNLY